MNTSTHDKMQYMITEETTLIFKESTLIKIKHKGETKLEATYGLVAAVDTQELIQALVDEVPFMLIGVS